MENQEKRTLWSARVQEAEEFNGSNREYCLTRGYSLSTFQYWKSKVGNRKMPTPTVPTAPSPFVKIEIERRGPTLPDAHWVAEIILHLSRVKHEAS